MPFAAMALETRTVERHGRYMEWTTRKKFKLYRWAELIARSPTVACSVQVVGGG